jgi:hypothetical protein
VVPFRIQSQRDDRRPLIVVENARVNWKCLRGLSIGALRVLYCILLDALCPAFYSASTGMAHFADGTSKKNTWQVNDEV